MSISHNNSSIHFSPSTYTPTRSRHTTRSRHSPNDSNLKTVHKKENQIYEINDQIIALSRLIQNESNKIANEKNRLQQRSLNILERTNEIKRKNEDPEEKRRRIDYEESTKRLEELKTSRAQLQVIIQQLNTEITQVYDQLANSYEGINSDPDNLYSKFEKEEKQKDDILFETEIQRRRIKEMNESFNKHEKMQNEIGNLEAQLQDKKQQLSDHMKELNERRLEATRQLSEPCDQFNEEISIVKLIEADNITLETRFEDNSVNEFGKEVDKAKLECEEFVKKVDARKRVLASMSNKFNRQKKGVVTEEPPRSPSHAPSMVTTVTQIQTKMASDVILDIFEKFDQREIEFKEEMEKIEQKQKTNRGSRSPRENEWKKKMDRAMELNERWRENEGLFFNIEAMKGKIDDLVRDQIELNYQIQRLNRRSERIEPLKQIIEKEKEEINSLSQIVQEKNDTISRRNELINQRKARIEDQQRELSEKEREVNELESLTEETESQLTEIENRFSSVTHSTNMSYAKLNINHYINMPKA